MDYIYRNERLKDLMDLPVVLHYLNGRKILNHNIAEFSEQ